MRARKCAGAALTLLLPLAMGLPGPSRGAETITWMSFDLPPVYIQDGPLAGQGVGDGQQIYLRDHLPDFEHRERQADISRLWYDIKNSPTICATDVYRNEEREKSALFSQHATLVPGYRLVALADRRADFAPYEDGEGKVDLDALSRAAGLRGAFVGGRVHDGKIDHLLQEKDRAVTLDSVTKGILLYNLLVNKRVDFIFAAPAEIIYYKTILKTEEEVAVFPIAGGRDFLPMYTACSRTEAGERVIAAVDRLLADQKNWRNFLSPLARWAAPSDFNNALAPK